MKSGLNAGQREIYEPGNISTPILTGEEKDALSNTGRWHGLFEGSGSLSIQPELSIKSSKLDLVLWNYHL